MGVGNVTNKAVSDTGNESGGFIEFLASGKEKLDNFQRDLASVLPAIPGQPAGKFQDIAIGIDMHPTMFPPSPIMAVPHVGMVFDILGAIFAAINTVIPEPPEPEETEGDPEPQPISVTSVAVAIVKALAPSVMVNNKFIANAGISIQHLPGIILHALPSVSPMASSEMFMGSSTVLADGSPFSYQFLPALSCNLVGIPAPFRPTKPKTKMSLMAPTAALVSVIPGGKPVLVGGPPTIDLLAMAMNLGLKGIGKLWKKGGKKFQKYIDNLMPKNPAKAKRLQPIKCKLFGEPVDAATGRVFAENTDFSLSGPIPLEWNRIYHSDGEVPSPIGSNWHHSYHIGYWEMENEFITILLPDSREIVVPPLHLGDRFYHRKEKITWFRDKEGYGYRNNDGLTYRFSQLGYADNFYPITQITNDLGFKIQFNYRNGGVLYQIIDSAGRLLDVTSDSNNRITGVSTNNNGEKINLIRYEVDNNDNLVKVTDANNVSKHFYYEGHLLVRLTNQSGLNFYWEYEGKGDNAKCIHTWGDNGILEYWTQYDKGKTMTTNAIGHSTTYYYDASNLIYRITDAKQGDTYQTYNEHQDLVMVVDPLGNTTKYNYDRNGNLVQIENANKEKTLLAYDKANRLIEYSTPGGAYLDWVYNEEGKLIERSYADGTSAAYTYEGALLKTIKDHQGRITTLHWGTHYNLEKVTLHDGNTMQWHYDTMGQVVQHIDSNNNITAYRYDAMGNVIRLTEPDGNKHNFTYDASGNVINAKDRNRNVAFTYWGLGNLKTRTENGNTITFNYNNEEQLLSINNEHNETYRFSLDPLGQIVGEWGFDGLQRRYARDRAGRVTKVLRAGERWTRYRYDGIGNILTANHHDGTGEYFSYDADGKLTEATNAFNTVKLAYHQGRVVEETQNEHTVESQYNSSGNRTKITSSLGADITHEFGRSGDVLRTSSQGWEAQFERDNMGLEIRRMVSGNVAIDTHRDNQGRVVHHSIQAKNVEGRSMRYRWGINDQLLSITNTLSNTSTTFGYDQTGNLQFAKYNGWETLYKMPDAIGNLFKSKNQNDRTYNKGGQLKKDDKAAYDYDAEGNLIRKTVFKADNSKHVGEWFYQWYGNGMLKTVTTPKRKQITFEYDALGRRTAKIVSSPLAGQEASITRFIWDGNVPLHEWTYNLEDRPKLYVDANGEIANDGDEPIDTTTQTTWLFEANSFVPAAKLVGDKKYSIACDYLGTPVQAYNEQGVKVWDCELDIYGTIRNIEGSKTFIPFRYQGQYEDIETGLYYNRFRYYSAETGGYISQDPIGLNSGEPNLYSYVHDSNVLVDPSGLSGIPSFDVLKDMAQNSLDFSTAKDGAVFWSGPRMKDAQKWAAANGKTTLEQTVGGKYLNDLELFDNMPGHQAAEIWDIASKKFADGASGNVNAFSTGAKRFGPFGERTWWRIEKPALLKNSAIKSIIRRNKNGGKTKKGHIKSH